MTHAHIDGKIILSGCLVINDKKEILLLYQTRHGFYETPGGKVRLKECNNPDDPNIEDLAKTVRREMLEELGGDIEAEELKYFDKVAFTIPDGRLAVANKFLTRIISGTPRIGEPELFSKLDYLPIERLEEYPISPDLQLLLTKLKDYARRQ